jgi:hypothetical protein
VRGLRAVAFKMTEVFGGTMDVHTAAAAAAAAAVGAC